MNAEDIIYPLARGDYIIRSWDHRIARVRSIWWDDYENEFCMNLTFFELSGSQPGRVSPAMGGPTNFEPAIPFNDSWSRIDEPNFPVKIHYKWVPTDDGGLVNAAVPGVDKIPFRKLKRKPKKPKKWKAGKPSPTRSSNFDPEFEAAVLRATAQNMRDTARAIGGEAANALKEKASQLEKNATDLLSAS